MQKTKTKFLTKKTTIILTILFILGFTIFFLHKNNISSKSSSTEEKISNIYKTIFITKQNYIKNPKKNSNKIIKNNSDKIIKIISKKNLKIYKNYDFFQVPVENYKINNKIANGFFITNNGLILTNKHILEEKNTEYIGITNNKKENNLEIIWISTDEDLVIFKIIKSKNQKVKFIKNYKKLEKDDFIFSLNSDKKIFFGKILDNFISIKYLEKKLNTNILEEKIIKNLIETNLQTNFGDSGSPLFNNKNEVIGINTLVKNNKNYSIILDEKKIKKILKEIE